MGPGYGCGIMHSFDDCADMRVIVREGGCRSVVVISGDLDAHSLTDLKPVLAEVIASGPATITLDLAAVTFFSCAAVTELQKARDRHPGRLHIAAASGVVTRILTILELDDSLRPATPA